RVVGGRLRFDGFRSSRAVQPPNRAQAFRPTSPIRECAGSREVKLCRPEIRVARYVLEPRRDASHLQPFRIKRYCEHRSLRNVDQMTAWQVPREHACMLDQDSRAAILQRHDGDSVVMISVRSARVEQYSLASW